LSFATVANANLVIEITQGRDDALPIAVVPFTVENGAQMPEDVAQIISDDLKRSGLFKPVPRGDLLSWRMGHKAAIWRGFRVMKTEYVVTGRVGPLENSRYSSHFELLDVKAESS